MKIDSFVPRSGHHCETTALGSLLSCEGFELSEPMLFGLGEGLNFFYWDMKALDFPMVLGRTRPLEVTERLAANLQLDLEVLETASQARAWENVRAALHHGHPVGLKLDSYYLDYFKEKFHFAAHVVAMYGYDNTHAYLVDTKRAGGVVKATLESVREARAAKGPMASKNLSFTLRRGKNNVTLGDAVSLAIVATAERFLNPPIKNIGYKGIQEFSNRILTWFDRTKKPEHHLPEAAMLMETAGTGGSLFRNIYTAFLGESAKLLDSAVLRRATSHFEASSKMWKQVIDLIEDAGKNRSPNTLSEASPILSRIAELERDTMLMLQRELR
jgi:hypothetical protein